MATEMDGLHERVAAALGWTVAEVRSFNILALRDVVRPVSPKLADALTEMNRSSRVLLGEPLKRGTP